jgi:hypothetical protein
MDIGDEDEKETWIVAPERETTPKPVTAPEPVEVPAEPVKV